MAGSLNIIRAAGAGVVDIARRWARPALVVALGLVALRALYVGAVYHPVLVSDIPGGGRLTFGYATPVYDPLALHGCLQYVEVVGHPHAGRYFVYQSGEPPHPDYCSFWAARDGTGVWLSKGRVAATLDLQTGEFLSTNGLPVDGRHSLGRQMCTSASLQKRKPDWASKRSGVALEKK